VSKKPTLTAFCRTKSIHDFQMLLEEIAQRSSDDDRRQDNRVATSLLIFVQPLDNQFRPQGQPFKAITRDLSANGLGFFHEFPFPTNFAQISANRNSYAKSIARICFNKVYHGDEMVYLIGAEFLPGLEAAAD
jgi:hypothetical protein